MKTQYCDMKIEIVILQAQDIVTFSGFNGGDHEFGNPNEDSSTFNEG